MQSANQICQTASTWIDSLDSLLDVYERVGDVLPDLTRYPKIYENYSHVLTHLQGYYCDILEFHSHALEVFSRSGKSHSWYLALTQSYTYRLEDLVPFGLEDLQNSFRPDTEESRAA